MCEREALKLIKSRAIFATVASRSCSLLEIDESLALTDSIISYQLVIKVFASRTSSRDLLRFVTASNVAAILPARFDETRAFVSFSLPEVALKR